jgi:hypothetical protein
VATGEWRKVADDYARLELRALRLFADIPEAARDAYRQSILFPVQAMANLYDMYYAQAMNRMLAKAGNPDANVWADKVAQCFERDAQLCRYYNKEMAGGKWDGMMTQKHIGYTSWSDNFPADRMPEVKRVSDVQAGGYVFAPSQGYVAMEAEHYFEAKAPAGTQWSIYPDYGRTRSAVALTPYTEPVDGASLTYRFRSEKGTVFDQGTNRKALIPSGVRKRPRSSEKLKEITTITMEVKAVEKKLKFSKSPLHSGNSTQNTEPLPKVDCTPTFPPRLKAMLRQMLSPRPVPGTNSSTFTKRSKRWSSQQSSGMPLPVSLTHIRNSLSCCSKPKVMDPSEVNLTALSTYWLIISPRRSLSVHN